MATTILLPPVTAVRMVWALTGAFSTDEHSKQSAVLVEAALKDLKQRAESDEKERQYVVSAIATMDASRRSLDVVYKGRELNFSENAKLREAYLKSVQENLEFGKKARDFIKSLPSMTIATAGSVTVAQALGLKGLTLWGIGLVLAALGYLVNLAIVRSMRKRTQRLYVEQDYERNLYYDQYVTRVMLTLTSLYLDLDRIHKNIFGQTYPVEASGVGDIIAEMLHGVRPTFCQYIHKHMSEGKITPELWSRCEAGSAIAISSCLHWLGEGGGT